MQDREKEAFFITKSDELKKMCAEKGIRMIDFKMIDLDGRWRHITIPVERFTEDIFTYGIGFDGSNYGYAPVEKSDMVDMADKTMIMKYVIRNAAVQEGKTATLMPKSLEEALDALEKDHAYLTEGGVFPERLIEIWLKRKRAESLEISQIPHPAEFEKYYDL